VPKDVPSLHGRYLTRRDRLCFDLAHDRMPVLLQPSDFDGWLNGTAGIAEACARELFANMAGIETGE
jgi:putative SOS response-associated peptidase YedK